MGELRWFLNELVIPRRKVFHLEYIPAVRETVLCDYILCQCRVCMNHVYRLPSIHLL